MRNHRDSFRRSGLTLLELLLALGLIILLSGMMFQFYEVSLKSREAGTERIRNSYLARLVARQIAEEIRGCNGFVKSVGPGVLGDDRFIQLQTITLPDPNLWRRLSIQDAVPPAECDVRQVQYYLAYDEDDTDFTYPDGTQAEKPLGLVRREVRTLHQALIREDQAQSVTLDLVSPEIRYVRFRYFDGADWIDRWDIGQDPEGSMGNPLPQAIEVTVGYRALPPKQEEDEIADEEDPDLIPSEPEPYAPDTYSIVVRLPQADTFFGSRLMRAQRRGRRGVGASGG